MNGIVLLAALLWLPARGAQSAGQSQAPAGPLLSDSEYQEIEKHKDDSARQILGARQVEPWTHLPGDRAQQRLIDQAFGAGTFQRAHLQMRFLLKAYLRQEQPPDQLKQGASDIVFGLSRVVGYGLDYAKLVSGNMPEARRQGELRALDEKMDRANDFLKSIPLGGAGRRGPNVEVALLSGEKKYGSAVMGIVAKISGFDKVQQVLNDNPGNADLRVSAGNAALAAGDPALAKGFFDQALGVAANDPGALSGRAAAEANQEDFQAASRDARRALAADPSDATARAVLRLAHPTLGGARFGGVSASAGLGASMPAPAPAALAAFPAGVAAAASKRQPGARDEKASFATVSPANSRAAAASGSPLAAGIKALNRAGLYRRGLAAADQALRVSPRDAYAHYMRAMALRGLGDRNGTLAELGKAAALDGRYRDAYALARSLGPNDDLSFLFPEEQLSAAKAALARRRAAAWPWMALPLVAGAGLALFGLSGLLFPGLGRRLRRLWRPGPALGRGQTAGLSAPAPWGLAPQTLGGRYRLLSAMGGGVHGDLYRALDQASGRPVVVRSLRLDMRSSDRQLWLGPARLARSLEHPGIAALLDVLEEDGALHLVSQFAEGRCLRESLAFEGALRWESAHAVFRQVAAALDYAHGRGVVHGAIKPSNIVVDASGAAKLTDFGLARHGAERGRDLQDLAACLRRSLGELPSTRSKVLDSALSGAAARASAGELVAAVAACPR